jgi:hypothetical protein
MKRLSILLVFVAGIAILLLANSNSTFAQGETGSVTGIVTDPQGGTVVGADVTLTDVATKSPRTTTTNESGRYHFASVPVGIYDLTVTKSGFKTHKAASQKVSVGTQLTLDVALEVGALTETVVVTAQAGTELQSSNATVGNTINLKNLELLPNLGRDATSLLGLQPGVTPRGDIAGSYMDQNTFTIDGGNNTDDMAGNTIGYIQNFTGTAGAQTSSMASGVVATPIETVEEFKVNTFGQTADFNASSGAQIQMVTRRGTDQWHGSGYGYYYATNHGAANSFFNNHTKFTKGVSPLSTPCSPGTTLSTGDNNCVLPYTPIIPNHRSRFGFTVGGPIIPKKFLGEKTYLFFGYEGFRFPNSTLFERAYPTPAFRAGVIQVPDASGVWQPYNLNPTPVTVVVGNLPSGTLRTVTLPGATATCSSTLTGAGCDPRLKGISPTVQTLWNTYLPLPNDPLGSFASVGDKYNTQGYLSTIRLPLTSNNYVWRLDHDFNSKHRFFGSFRAFKLLNIPNVQVDVGGLLSGRSVGQYTSTAQRPQLGELMVLGLTSNLTPRLTNDLRLSYLWNWWQWSTGNDPPQLPGLGGALEIAPAGTGSTAESVNALIPYNVNNQSTRQRVWDGQDKMIRDDLSWVKGNHLIQFGGQFQNNFNYHTRTDNGSTINNQVVYQIARSSISFTTGCGASGTSSCTPSTVPSAQASRYRNLAASALGLVGLTQVIYTRTGSDLKIQPIGTVATEQSTIKYYSGYVADTWRMRSDFTISYGVSYTYETPPVEKNGAQVELVDASGNLIHTNQFMAARKAAALAGQAYAPVIGFETTGNLHMKYPYNPFKKGISPRVSVAWNPNYRSGLGHMLFGEGQTVIRAGYNRIFGRINGVNQVLVPLLGPGLLQPVTCSLALSNGTCGTSGSVNLTNVFRIGVDGLVAPLASPTATLPQPFLPGRVQNGVLNAVAGDSTVLDPDYKPEKVDTIDFTIQRQISRKMSIEVGFLHKSSKNVFAEIDLDAVPYMMTLGGQDFKTAMGNLYRAICGLGPTCSANAYTGPAQPFFEAALSKAGGTYCNGFANCTAAVASKQLDDFKNTTYSNLWNTLAGSNSWILGRTMLGDQATAVNTTTSLGYSNYNAMFITFKANDWHGMNAISNFTWGKALGTQQLAQYNSSETWTDPWVAKNNYGPQNFDIKYLFNAGVSYRPSWFRGTHGWKSRLLDGWSVSPFLTMQSGFPIRVTYSEGGTCSGDCQAFGQVGNPSSSSSAYENAIPLGPIPATRLHRNVQGSNGIGLISSNPEGLNIYGDPAAVFNLFRKCVLGIDDNCGGTGNLRGFNRWNVDATLAKDVKFTERVGATLTLQFTNVFNHFQPADPSCSAGCLSLTSPDLFGSVTGQTPFGGQYASRQMEIGLRIHF